MIWIYAAAAIFGGAFVIPMVLGGVTSDLGEGLDVDADVEMDVAVDVDVEAGSGADLAELADSEVPADGPLDASETDSPFGDAAGGSVGDALGSIFASLLSFRTVVFFSAFFGAAGLVFDAIGYTPAVTLATAILIGAIAAFANSVLFGLIRSSQPNSQISDRTLEGRPALVVLPMDDSRRGRIRIDLSGQPQYMVARPVGGSEQQFDVGAPVVVVKIEEGTALVASLADLDLGEE